MPKIDVVTQLPAPRETTLTVWIDLGSERPLASNATLKGHAGWFDAERRRKVGAIKSAYLTASSPQLLVMPAASASYYSDDEKVKTLAARAFKTAQERMANQIVFVLDAAKDAEEVARVAEGVGIYAYKFDKYKKKPEKPTTEPNVQIVVSNALKKQAASAVKERLALVENINRARELINEPGSVADPAFIEQRAREMAKRAGLKIIALDARQLAKEGYEGLLSVGRGGNVPPRMIVMHYRPSGSAKSKAHLGLLGKGVTFDTGGVSIKPAGKMWEMKGDMSGAAAVIYAMETIARLKPKIPVTGVVVTSQNYMDANAIVPGDIIRARNGKCIHVDNTDAEGRLILTDGLWRMGEEKVTHLVDVATLTGAVVRALGTSISGAFGNDAFADQVVRIAERCGESCWRLPMVEEYMELLKTEVADINNIGSKPEGGAITAALFLREFIPEGVSWTHLDIAGTFLLSGMWKYFRSGGTGVMVKTLAALAEEMAAS